MALVRWDPFADLRSLHTQVDDMFNQMFNDKGAKLTPTTDVYTEDGKDIVVEAQLPNFTEKDVSVEVHQGVLEISAKHSEKEEKDKGQRKYLLRESSSSYYRRLELPARADADGVKANFKNGTLKVTVPLKELPKPKSIKIEAGKEKKK